MHPINLKKAVTNSKNVSNTRTFLCVLQFTIHHYFQMIPKAVIIRKGIYSNLDSYSAFADNADLNETQLYRDLKKRCITDIFVCGIATDVCVGKYTGSKNLFQVPTQNDYNDFFLYVYGFEIVQ